MMSPARAGSTIGVGITYRLGLFPTITDNFGAWINHSYAPTASLKFSAAANNGGAYLIVANNDLKVGDEVTVDYRQTPWYVLGPDPSWPDDSLILKPSAKQT